MGTLTLSNESRCLHVELDGESHVMRDHSYFFRPLLKGRHILVKTGVYVFWKYVQAVVKKNK